MQTVMKLPGISFETQPRQAAGVLPRMDIAAFVGFASAGPLHTPVPVEDTARFREIFGDDVPLAWDRENRCMEYSYLGPSVEAFFRNGGRRCWVVRVAGEDVSTNVFALPGLIRIKGSQVEETVFCRARCPGTWSDHLRVGTVLQTTRLILIKAHTDVGKDRCIHCQIDVAAPQMDIKPGDLFQIEFPGDEDKLFLFAAEIIQTNRGIRIKGFTGYWFRPGGDESPPGRLFPLADAEKLGCRFSWPDGSPESEPPRVSLLRFEIVSWRNGLREYRMSELGFSAQQPRCWEYLPDDADLFQLPGGRPQAVIPSETYELVKESADPRFPIAGPIKTKRSATGNSGCFYLPVNMTHRPDPDMAVGPYRPSGDDGSNRYDLKRNGLECFESRIFMDDALSRTSYGSLMQEAERRYTLSDKPARPRGIHSLIPVDEVTLMAAPDAVHRQWSKKAPPIEELLKAPDLQQIDIEEATGQYHISWSKIDGVTSYILQHDTSPDFTAPTSLHIRGESIGRIGQPQELFPEPATSSTLAMPPDCPLNRYFRVRSERLGTVSAWSNSRAAMLPFREFSSCQGVRPDLLELTLEKEPLGSPHDEMHVWLSWTLFNKVGAPNAFDLYRATDIEFQTAQLVYQGASDGHLVPIPPDEVVYYRVRALNGDMVGPWSNTIRLVPTTVSLEALENVSEYAPDDLLNIQRAMIIVCAARSDMMAILSFPRHYRASDALEHVAKLTPSAIGRGLLGEDSGDAAVLTINEQRALSYAALYHPWQAEPGKLSGLEIRYIPPDGAITGSIAKRTLELGAWTAPANEPLTGILGLDPDLGRHEWERLMLAGVNVLRQNTRGFLVMSSDTLSPDSDLRPINVRRLMILLRRLAHREGTRFVFEPNNRDFHRRVSRQFELLLSDMYLRGAFAGTTAEGAYRIVADSSVNTRESLDQGRFIVDLQVAPSQPMKYLTVRLVQSGPNDLRILET